MNVCVDSSEIEEFRSILSNVSDQNKGNEEYGDMDLLKRRLKLAVVGKSFGNDSVAGVVDSGRNKQCAAADENDVSCFACLDGMKRCDEGGDEASYLFGLDEDKMSSYNGNECRDFLLLDGSNRFFDNMAEYGGDRFIFDSTAEAGCSVTFKGGKFHVKDEEDGSILGLGVANKKILSSKRKRCSISEMLNWLTQVANDPCDSVIGTLPEKSKWNSYGGDEYWKQVLLAREALFLVRPSDSAAQQSIFQRKQRMHPSLYEDHISYDDQLTKVLRCSKRLLLVKKILKPPTSPNTNMEEYQGSIPVGPLFQAKVPTWSGMVSESDPKWLGHRVWPLENSNAKFLVERERIGKGRQDSCGCYAPDSVDCVRFHVSEKRKRLQLELGPAFHGWDLDKAGECVAQYWTAGDKEKFEATLKSNPPSLSKCFWDEVFKALPFKSREDVVSYYFNVSLLCTRMYQNRCTLGEIDSDDDESEPQIGRTLTYG